MKKIFFLSGFVGVFLPHLWSLMVILRALPMISLGGVRLELLFLPLIFAGYRLVENLLVSPVFAVSEMFYILAVAISLLILMQHHNMFDGSSLIKGMLLGGVMLALIGLLNFFDSIYLFKPWTANPSEVRLLDKNSFKALSSNAIINKDLGYIGPGILKIYLRLRHSDPDGRELQLPVSLVQKGGPNSPDAICTAKSEWQTCTFTLRLETRSQTVLWLGGWDHWSNDTSSTIDVSSLRIFYLTPLPLKEIIFNSGRRAGLTFNSNALGMTSLICILVVATLSIATWPLTTAYAVPFAVLLILSGSRASLGGLLVFIFLLFLNHNTAKRILGYLLPFLVLAVLSVGFHFSPEDKASLPRILNPFAERYQESRVSLYVEVLSRVGLSLTGVPSMRALLNEIQNDLGLGSLEHAHSLWLQVYGVSGLLGLAIFALGFLITEKHLNRKQLRIAHSAFFALYFVSFFDYFTFYPPYYILLFSLSYLALGSSYGRVKMYV